MLIYYLDELHAPKR